MGFSEEERKIHTKFWKENLKEIFQQEDLCVNRCLILKRISNRMAGGGFDSSAS